MTTLMINGLSVLMLLFFGAIIGLFSVLIPRVIDQASGLSDQVVSGFERLQQTFVSATLMDSWTPKPMPKKSKYVR